jgi:tight adherence protein B
LDRKIGWDDGDDAPTRKERAKYYALCAAGLAFVGFLFFNSPIAAAVLGLCSIPLERYWRQSRAAARRRQLASQFKDLLFSLSASFQSGRHMREALAEAQANMQLAYPADAPINTELARMVRGICAGGEREKDVLFEFARRSGIEDAMNFADVYFTCLATGGDVVRVTAHAAEAIMDKMAIRREIEMLTAQKKYEAKMLTALPILILLYLKFSSPGYLTPLYTTLAGLLVMVAALGALAVSFFWGEKIMEIEV